MSASLIGRSGSSAFKLSMSLAGSCFSSESAHRPFHHGIRRQGGTIFRATLPIAVGRSKRTCELTSSIVPQGHHPPCGGARVSPIAFDPARLSCRCDFSGPAELGAIYPDAVHTRLADAPGRRSPFSRPGHICRSTSIFLISAIALAGLRPFGHALAQFRMVWQR
jgi:hypothetical protein